MRGIDGIKMCHQNVRIPLYLSLLGIIIQHGTCDPRRDQYEPMKIETHESNTKSEINL